MKIFHINVSFTLGGLETMLIDIMNEQCKYAEVTLLIINNKVDHFLLDGMDKRIKYYFLDREEGGYGIIPLLRLNYIICKSRPDVIHCHHFKVAPAILKLFKFNLFLTVHDMRFEIKYYNLYDTIFGISKAVAADILERSGYKAEVVYNGIDFEKIEKKLNLEEINKKFKIVQISRLVHLKKGQHILLAAVKKLITEYGYDNIEVDFIGDGLSLDYLKDLTAEYGLTNVVKFLGNQDRAVIYDNLYKYSLLVQPSLYEGFGLTIIEGIAANIPVISSDVDGPGEIAKTLDCDFLFKSGSVDELAAAISGIYLKVNASPGDLLTESMKLSEKAEHFFSIKNTTANYLKYYKKQK